MIPELLYAVNHADSHLYRTKVSGIVCVFTGQMDDAVFVHGVGSQLMLQETMHHGSSHGLIKNASKRLLQNDDEVKAVMRHVNNVRP